MVPIRSSNALDKWPTSCPSKTLKDSSRLSCVLFEEGCGIWVQSENQLTRTWWRRPTLAPSGTNIDYQKAFVVLVHGLRSANLVERYETIIHNMGTHNDFASNFSLLALRTTFPLKGESILGLTLELPYCRDT